MSSINTDVVPKQLVAKIKHYFDYLWFSSGGINNRQILQNLPKRLTADILCSRYAEAIKNSLIFKNEDGKVNQALTNSILTMVEIRLYMEGDFIVFGGSTSQSTYIILEGEAYVLGFNEETIAYMRSGAHYSNDLDPEDPDILDYKRPLHIVSHGFSVVGVLDIDKLLAVYCAYPEFKEKLRLFNKQITRIARKFLRRYLFFKDIDYTPKKAVEIISDHYSYSSESVYDSIRQK